MNTMVSARVPVEVRDQVNEGLRAIGSSPTELINSASAFFLENRRLPQADQPVQRGRRMLSAEQQRLLAESVAATTYPVPGSYFAAGGYDEMLTEELRRGYEALA